MPDANAFGSPKQSPSNARRDPPRRQAGPKAPALGALARVYWMLVGPAILALAALLIVQQGRDRTGGTDATFWATVTSIVLVRYLDIARILIPMHPSTSRSLAG